MTNNKRRFDLHDLVDLMEDSIEKLSKIGKKFKGGAIGERNEALDICSKHLIEAAAILREQNDEDLNHEITLLETVIRMVQDEIVD